MPEIVNLLGVGDIVYVKDYDKYLVVVATKPISLIEVTISGTIPAGGSLENQKIDLLKLENGQIAQYHLIPIDDIEVVIKVGGSKGWISSTKNIVSKITRWHKDNLSLLWRLTLFWQIEDEDLFFDLYNKTATDISNPTLYIFGYKYLLEPISKEEAIGKKIKVISAKDFIGTEYTIRKSESITGG